MKKILFILLLCSGFVLFAQNKKERADKLFNDFKFDKAIPLYEDLAASNRKPNPAIIQFLADSYFNMANYQKATDWYSKLYDIEGEKVSESNILKLVQCLKASQRIKDADKLLRKFYSDKTRLDMIMAQKRHLDSILLIETKYAIETLGFNSKKSDFAPTFYEGGLVFASTRDTIKSNGKLYPWNNQPYLDLYVTKPKIQEYVPEKFLMNLESNYHDSNVAFAPDSKTIYFTRNYLKNNKLSANEEGLANMQILKGTIYNNTLIDVKPMSFNSTQYSCGHPTLSSNGSRLYFTSNMQNGYGESDIYVVDLGPNGDAINPPVNLGPAINTKGREMFPFVNENILYFSSDAHYGLGGLDVFASKILSDTDYSLPLNMGKPINSNMDDFSLIKDFDSGEGYFASNRFGGIGDDDIYKFRNKKPVDCLDYSGYVLNEQTKEPISLASVEVYTEENGMIGAIKTDEHGYFNFTLPCNKTNQFIVFKPRFSKKKFSIITGENPQKPSENNLIYLTPFDSLVEKDGDIEKIKVNPIYFEYDKWDITPRAEIELEKVLFAMGEFPEIKIKIESHTDSRGSDQYNLKLSDNRAKSTMQYLISKGIAANRIESAIGYGESRLKNNCSNGIKCSEQDHLINRRSDFIIVAR